MALRERQAAELRVEEMKMLRFLLGVKKIKITENNHVYTERGYAQGWCDSCGKGSKNT